MILPIIQFLLNTRLKYQNIKISKYQKKNKILKYQNIKISKYQNIKISKYQKNQNINNKF